MWTTSLIISLVISIHVTCCSSHDISHFSLEEITSLFGSNECIEGSLVEFQQPTAGLPTIFAYEDLQVMLKKFGGRMAQEWMPSVSSIYNGFTSTNITDRHTETKTRPEWMTKSTRSEYNALDFKGRTPMSVVNELSLLTKVRPEYSLIDVRGPDHEKSFTVSLKFGSEEYSASGPSIKKAQQLAANKFLQYTHHHHHLQQMIHKQQMRKKNVGTKTATSIVYEIAAQKKLPLTFEVESQTGPPHKPTFMTKCALGDRISRGQGSSKKLSKRAAAEQMLELLQYTQPNSFLSNTIMRKSRKKRRSSPKKKRNSSILNTFEQRNPGFRADETIASIMNSEFFDASNDNSKGLNERLATFAKQLVKSGSSFLGEATTKSTLSDGTRSTFNSKSQDQVFSAKDMLTEAADLLDFKFHFTDLPKTNNEFVSLVSMATNRPSICLGVGSSVDASQEQAARRALKALWKLDVQQISPNSTSNKKSELGDWVYWSEKMLQNTQDLFHIK